VTAGTSSIRAGSTVRIGRDALVRHRLDDRAVDASSIEVADGFTPLFDERGQGFEVPLLDGRNVVGVLTIEYEPGQAAVSGDLSILVPLALDLSAKLRTGRLLRESRYLRDYLSKLLEHANAPIIVIGRQRDIRVVNRAFLALTGMERDLVLARDFFDLLPVEETTRLLPVFINALRGEPTTSFEVRIPRADGGAARLLVNTASIFGPQGGVDAVIAIGRDLTELRELEAQVIHAEKLATLGQLAASVVHELNNPLTSISAYADHLALKHAHDSDKSELEKLERIRESVDRILKFTRDLVTYARPAGEEPRLVSIHDVLNQAIAFCDHVLSNGRATVETTLAKGLPPIYAVPSHLHQVFINLITNASQAMRENGGTVRIETGRDADGNVVVRVSDEGVGIERDKLDRIFDPFYSTKREGEGTGLGLSIVKNILEQHRGSIRVESTVRVGSVFTVTLPSTTVR
jgi:PAS domain S-box-containing protein